MSANGHQQAPTILVVEDEVLVRLTLADYLQDNGFKVLEAGSAEDAVDIIEKGDAEVDLVFSDIMMPGKLNGFGLASWVHTHHPDLPVLLTSGHSKSVAESMARCGTVAMPKPYNLGEVMKKIRRLV
ncbi:MAG TPA: response regulator [Rhizomicrobium sp.]|jgi:DNA-binding NtrC family response regulator